MGAERSTIWLDMFPSVRSPGSCQHLREQGMINGARCYYVLSCVLLCATRTGHHKIHAHLSVFEQNISMLVWRWLSLTHAGLGKLIPGDIGQTFFNKCMESRGVFSPLHAPYWCLIKWSCSADPVQRA